MDIRLLRAPLCDKSLTYLVVQVGVLSLASKSRTINLVSSVPFLEPTAQTSLVALARILQTTPPLPPLFRDTRSRMNSPEKIVLPVVVSYNALFWKITRSNWLTIIHFPPKSLPVLTSHNLTVPSSDDVTTNLLLN